MAPVAKIYRQSTPAPSSTYATTTTSRKPPYHDAYSRQPTAAAPARDELGQHGLSDGVFRADRYPEQEPEHQQLHVVGDHALQCAEHHERDEVQDEDLLAAEPVGQRPEEGPASVDAAMSPAATMRARTP
jgi:hypothetical protein